MTETTDLFVITAADDAKSAIGPFTKAGVIAWGRAMLQEGADDAFGSEVYIDFGKWGDAEILEEIADQDFAVRALQLTTSVYPAYSVARAVATIAEYTSEMVPYELELMYGTVLGQAILDLRNAKED